MQNREYPDYPLVGVGGVVISGGRVLLARRGTQPLRGEWSIPGGLLETGETLAAGVARELFEETGLTVHVIELIDAVDRIFPAAEPASDARTSGFEPKSPAGGGSAVNKPPKPRYHYVLLDYLCEVVSGEPVAGSDVTSLAFVREDDLEPYRLAPSTLDVVHKAFALARAAR